MLHVLLPDQVDAVPEGFLSDDGQLLLNKIGTAPGLRKNSVYPKLMEHLGMDQEYLFDKLLEQAIENSERNY